VDPGNPTVAVFNPTAAYVQEDVTAANTVTVSNPGDIESGDIIRFGEDATNYTVSGVSNTTVTFSPNATVTRGANVLVSTNPVVFSDDNIADKRTLDLTFKASDYFHLISCKVLWKTKRPSNGEVTHIEFPVKRLTNDMLNAIQNNTYLSPAPNRPYYQLYNSTGNVGGIAFPTTLEAYKALQNKPRIKVHLGNKTSVMELRSITFEYIKLPATVILSDSDIFTAGDDYSQIIELPDYLKNEVVKRCTAYLLEKAGDPRMQTQPAFNQEIPQVPMNMQSGGSAQPRQASNQQ
jgi:hypothetical protein